MKKILSLLLVLAMFAIMAVSVGAYGGLLFEGVKEMSIGVPVHYDFGKSRSHVYRFVLDKPTKLKIDIEFNRRKGPADSAWTSHDMSYTIRGDWFREFLPGGSKSNWNVGANGSGAQPNLTEGYFSGLRQVYPRSHNVTNDRFDYELLHSVGEADLLPAGTYYLTVEYDDAWADERDTYTVLIDCIHESTSEKITNPTCSKAGKKSVVCDGCDKTIETETIEKLPHTPADESEVVEATCTKAGKKVLFCTVCKKTIETETIEKLPHNFSEWTVTKEVTCKAAGQRVRICSGCAKKETETIEKLPHDFSEWTVTKEATCKASGSMTHKCISCGKTETQTLEKLPHNVEEWTITQEATETKQGTRKGKCVVCKKTITENYNKYPGKNGFKKSRDYGSKFSDVGSDKWFYEYVQTSYEYSLANGTSDTKFSPDSKFTVAQALTAAANIHSAYYAKEIGSAKSGEAWYVPYVNYCIENGIIEEGQFKDYNKNIKRGEMAQIFANVLPAEEYTSVRSGAPSDMSKDMASYDAVTKLYGAGIVSGDAGNGKFRPNDEIVRSEACVIFTRIAVDTYRAK